MCFEIHWHWQQTPLSVEKLLCVSYLHTDISNTSIFVIRWKRRVTVVHTRVTRQPSEHLCRRYMRSTECTSSCTVCALQNIFVWLHACFMRLTHYGDRHIMQLTVTWRRWLVGWLVISWIVAKQYVVKYSYYWARIGHLPQKFNPWPQTWDLWPHFWNPCCLRNELSYKIQIWCAATRCEVLRYRITNVVAMGAPMVDTALFSWS